MLVNCACAMMWVTGSSAPNTMAAWMHVDLTQLNWLSNVAAISNAIFSLVAAYAYERFGVKVCIVVTGCINFIGCWIRCFAIIVAPEKRYILVMLGQVVSSIGGPFVYNLFLYGLLQNILIIIAVIATVSTIPVMLTPSKPKNAPSVSADIDRMGVWEGFKTLAKDFQFWTICISTAVNVGMFFTICVVVIEAATPFGYTEQQSGIAASMLMLSGFIGGVVENGYGILLCICFMIGFFSMGLFPVQLEYACEISFPVPESVSSNIIWSLSTAFMLVFTIVTDALRAGPTASPPNNMTMSMIATAILVSVGSIPCIWLKGDMKRMAFDKQTF
ncbi:major facilitator superfamily domain-containing protein [Zychaea mexicana]|uniref:major facilitator superfamily domain-containing protein n=1 Tax=Zychaea mexicana TaxID=64656 RepID=UPI0022FEBBE3|nr:major facilitator superfamily domain-containing protein [Zychaea mexicana]KAI9484967.1 major facilitator superfamily domain-containing protein [Zychaea mexicana]